MPIRAAAVVLALVAGCALTHRPADQAPKIETMLAAAGFQAILADTPEKLEHLKSLRPYTLTYSTRRGKPHYWYADPSGCRCLYVGTRPLTAGTTSSPSSATSRRARRPP